VTQPGRYFIQVRSNVPFSAGQQNDGAYLSGATTDSSAGGQNRYSLRTVNGGTNTYTTQSTVYAVARLPVYTNVQAGVKPSFFLARLLPGGGSAGRTLNLEFYDIGDVAGTTSLTIVKPPDPGATGVSCDTWIFNGDVTKAAPAGSSLSNNGCTLNGITSATYPNGFNGVLVDVKIKVPPSYTCDVNAVTGCWFKIAMDYTGQANDTTTWSASIGGDPVRLIQ
jgi:hypothetical protein